MAAPGLYLSTVENGIAIKYQVLSRYVCGLRREDAGKFREAAQATGKHRSISSIATDPAEASQAEAPNSDPLARPQIGHAAEECRRNWPPNPFPTCVVAWKVG